MKKRIVGLIGAALLILLPVVAWGAASTTWFTDSAPPASPAVPGAVAEYRVGELIDDQNKVYVQVSEPDLAGNFLGDTVLVRIENVTTPGDYIDNFPLTENIGDTGFFNNSTNLFVPNSITLIPATGAPDTTDLNLEVNPGDTIRVLYIDPNDPSDTSADTAEAVIGPVNLYEDVAGTGAAEYANLKGAFEHINDLAGPPVVTGALGAAVGVVNPIIEVEETYDSAVEDNFPFDLNVANMILRAIGTAGRTIVDAQGGAVLVAQIRADGVTVDGFTIRNNFGGAPGIWVADARQGITICNCIFEAITGDAIQLENGVIDPVIENNTIKHATGWDGIWFTGMATRAVVRGNTISDPGGTGIVFGGDANESVVTHNVITKAGVDGIALWGKANGANVSNNTITAVGATGIVLGDTADGATFSTNQIKNAALSGMSFNSTVTGVLIVSNIISSCDGNGIIFGGPPPITYQNVMIVGNEITGMTFDRWSCGIIFPGADTFQDITISGNTIASNSNGIVLVLNAGPANQMANVRIEDNVIQDHSFNDPLPPPPPGCLADAALYSQCGIYILSGGAIGVCTGNSISGNEIVGNETGLDIDESRPTICYKWTSSFWTGPFQGSGNIHGFDVTKNQFDDNYIGVAVGHQNNNINRNNFTDHHLFGVDARTLGAGQVDATNNWWGHSTGPYHLTNSTGRGDAVSDHVAFDPWYQSLACAILVGDAVINPAGPGEFVVSVGTDLMAVLQVGPTGKLTISDSDKIDVSEVEAVHPYELYTNGLNPAWNADDPNTAGQDIEVVFAVALKPGETPVAGPVVKVKVQGSGVGSDGDVLNVAITNIDVLRDADGDDLAFDLADAVGTITLDATAPGVLRGDVDGDGSVTLDDAAMVARHAIGIQSPSLTVAQILAGDVVSPYYPPPANLDMSDAARIAEHVVLGHPLSLMAAKIGPRTLNTTAQMTINENGQLVISGSTAELAAVQGRLLFDPVEMSVSEVVGLNGFVVLASAIDNVRGEVRFGAANFSGRMVGGAVLQFICSGDTSQVVIGVDVLRDIYARDVPVSLTVLVGGLEFGNYPNPITDVHTTTFEIKGLMVALVEAIKVRIFDLSGRLVYESEEVAGTSLDWHTDNNYGEYLANGVYLYKLYALINDQWVISETKKLVILR